MKRFGSVWVRGLCVVSIAVAAVGCGSDGGGDGGGVTFTEVNERVIQPSCTLSASCHQSGARVALIDLQTDPYGTLVGGMAKGAKAAAAGKILVVAGDPDASYLMEKLTSAMPTEGVQMPFGGQPLNAERLDLVRSWIAGGALDD